MHGVVSEKSKTPSREFHTSVHNRKPIGWKLEDSEFADRVCQSIGWADWGPNRKIPNPKASFHLFSDGSFRKRHARRQRPFAGWGFALFSCGAEPQEHDEPILTGCGPVVTAPEDPRCKGATQHSNNSGELAAIIYALLALKSQVFDLEAFVPVGSQVIIYTDSMYALEAVLGKSRATTNLEFISMARFLWFSFQLHFTVSIRWVKSHADSVGNSRADLEARVGANINENIWWTEEPSVIGLGEDLERYAQRVHGRSSAQLNQEGVAILLLSNITTAIANSAALCGRGALRYPTDPLVPQNDPSKQTLQWWDKVRKFMPHRDPYRKEVSAHSPCS